MTLTEEPSGLWRLDTGGTLIGYDGEHNVCSIQIKLANVIGTWTWYLDIAYLDGTVATIPLEQVKDTISALLSRSYMREGLAVVQVRGVSAGSAVKKSSVARVRFGSSVNASEQLAPPTPSQWDIYAAQVAGYRDEAAASAAAAALAATQMPYINSGGTWSVWSTSAGGFVDSGVSAAGITPDIQIGTVTTLPAGSEATASMSGTAAEPLLNLGIPKGDKGDPGSGGGISALYMRVDNGVIQYSADGVSWADLISTAELTGPAGSPGEQGPPGSDGVSPTVTVTQTATGAVITATDASGTTSATVFNGQDGLPGQPGADGSPGAPGHTPEITASKSGKVTTIMADGTAIAEISDGADGAPGAAGADGVTPDIQIGTVTTLPAGSEATASMSGTAAEPLLNLGIPKGDKGDSGGASAAELSLGITSATIGQTIKVKAVDTDGKPTAWEPVDMTGGDLSWIEVADITTEEQTKTLTISTDKDGRPISQYNALGMIFSILFPADATQTSDDGTTWVYPYPKIGENTYRYIATIYRWKTVDRTLTYAWAGLPRVPWSSAMEYQTTFGTADTNGDVDFMSGLCVYVNKSGDHIPAGTRVRIAVLSNGVTE